MTESTWQLDLLNSAKPGSSTPLRKPIMPIIDLTNIASVRKERKRGTCMSVIIFTVIIIILYCYCILLQIIDDRATRVVRTIILESEQKAR